MRLTECGHVEEHVLEVLVLLLQSEILPHNLGLSLQSCNSSALSQCGLMLQSCNSSALSQSDLVIVPKPLPLEEEDPVILV